MEIKEKIKFQFTLFGYQFKIYKEEKIYTRAEIGEIMINHIDGWKEERASTIPPVNITNP